MNPELPKQPLASYVYGTMAVLMPMLLVGTVLQPFLPRSLQTTMIVVRFVVVPGLLAFFFFTLREQILFAAILLFLVFELVRGGNEFDSTVLRFLFSIMGLLPFFKAGAMLGSSESGRVVWRALLFTTVALNIFTIALYGNSFFGGSIGAEAFEKVQRAGEDPLFRFALGNAVEVPAALAIATIAASVVLRGHSRFIPYALVLSLVMSVISQSRFVVVISGYGVLKAAWHMRPAARALLLGLVVGALLSQGDALTSTLESLVYRFRGEDSGSAIDRLNIVWLLVENYDFPYLTFGNGIGSSLDLMEAAGFGYRTMESALLQLLYEIGLLGIATFLVFIGYATHNAGLRFRLRVEFLLVAVQLFLLQPVNGYLPLSLFCAGALCFEFHHRDTPAKASRAKVDSRNKSVQSSLAKRAQAPVVP